MSTRHPRIPSASAPPCADRQRWFSFPARTITSRSPPKHGPRLNGGSNRSSLIPDPESLIADPYPASRIPHHRAGAKAPAYTGHSPESSNRFGPRDEIRDGFGIGSGFRDPGFVIRGSRFGI